VKLNFSQGAKILDPQKLFNAELDGNARRYIKFREGDKVNERALKEWVNSAVGHNRA
jgi:hypothetical protein